MRGTALEFWDLSSWVGKHGTTWGGEHFCPDWQPEMHRANDTKATGRPSLGLCRDETGTAVDFRQRLVDNWNFLPVSEQFARDIIHADELHAGVFAGGEQLAKKI